MRKIKLAPAFDYSKNRKWGEEFARFDTSAYERLLRIKEESFWVRAGQVRALKLFHDASRRVPAYKDFLKKHAIRAGKIRNIQDFAELPVTTKKNYINKYPLESRCWDGKLSASDIIAVSSGTDGEPKFWPRGGYQEFEAGIIHELIYKYHFEIDKYKTLMIIGFPMGVYVSGVATVVPSMMVAEKGYDLSIVSVGNNKIEALRAVKNLQSKFEQIILVGHPFFVKDVIETGRETGINWRRNRLRMMFCSGGFNETWRRVVIRETGHRFEWENIISTYGSSELLLMGHETPMSILIRNLAEKNHSLHSKIFQSKIVPHLFQYNPFLRYIESVKGDLVFTSASGLPLVRFNIKDSGELISFREAKGLLDEKEPKWQKELKNDGASSNVWQLPFVGLYGRSDYTVIFYAANIYPEHIELGLNNKAFLKKLTGKFTMHKDHNKKMDEYLEINIELRGKVKPSAMLAHQLQKRVVETLKEVNSEYLDASTKMHKDMRPRIKLWKYQDQKYFKPGLKPKFIAE